MKKGLEPSNYGRLVFGLWLAVFATLPAQGQTPQDNWYAETRWTKTGGGLAVINGGLAEPYGVAIGPDRRVYVGDQSYRCVQVYLPDGSFSFSITNAGGQSLLYPRGMIFDSSGKLYVADYGNNCVFVFTAEGAFIRKIGTGTGSGNGQLSGVMDVGVDKDGEVYILERNNGRVSVFGPTGDFLRNWGQLGELDGQLYNPVSLAVSADASVYVAAGDIPWNRSDLAGVKVFDKNGVFLRKISPAFQSDNGQARVGFCPQSVRLDSSGLLHVIVSFYVTYSGTTEAINTTPFHRIYHADGGIVQDYRLTFNTVGPHQHFFLWPCHALGPDGTMILCNSATKQLSLSRQVLREQYAVPRNAIPMPAVIAKLQRPNSPLVDIDYRVTDADDTNVTVGLLVFTNSSSTASLSNLLRNPTLVENTQTNLGPGIVANTVRRLTWNAGADWSVNLGNYRVAVMAQDSRTNLLDIHYLRLPADGGMPELKISRSPLNTNDFMQVWWWLLATNDTGIALATNRLYGAAGTYAGKLLHAAGSNTADGRAYIYEKLRVREATPPEVQWAKQATMPAGSPPNQWSPARQVSGRPAAVNEYGFDTGNWDTNTCKWVVPLN
jgi:DNA-binding beta-propeller fold protein YncE